MKLNSLILTFGLAKSLRLVKRCLELLVIPETQKPIYNFEAHLNTRI